MLFCNCPVVKKLDDCLNEPANINIRGKTQVSFLEWEFLMSLSIKLNHVVELFLSLETNSSRNFCSI